MTESYLHFIWKTKRLPFHQFKTVDGKNIEVTCNGIHNISESGPDFFNARMIYDKMEWVGQIEIHIKSSDWYKHNHHYDRGYDNVILHVVYEHDKDVLINGKAIPTLELKNYIDKKHFADWEHFAKSIKDISCEDSIHTIDLVFLKSMMHRAVVDRFDRKIDQLLYREGHLNDESILYLLLARAFGAKVNALPFELLTNELPLAFLKRLNQSMQRKLLISASGLPCFEQQELDIQVTQSKLPSSVWKRKGLHPSSSPEKRIQQFAFFISLCDFELLANYCSPTEAYEYISLIEKQLSSTELKLSKQLITQLFINAFLPYYWLISKRSENDNMQEFILSFLEQLPAEDNFILRKWNKIDVHAHNAYESQALIEIYNEYCTHKKCLSCQVGVKILNRTN